MGHAQAQDIIDWIIGRGHSAPDAFVQAKWPIWMRLRPRASLTRRDAMLALPDRRRAPAVTRGSGAAGWLHWLGLLCWQMGREPLHDQRWQRRVAMLFSAALHALFVLLLVWVALVRSMPPASEPAQRVALRFVSAGEGHVQGADGGDAAAVASPALVASQAPSAAGSDPPARTAGVVSAPAPVPAVAEAGPAPSEPSLVHMPDQPEALLPVSAPLARAQPLPEVTLPAPAMAVPERELEMARQPARAQAELQPVALPAPQIRPVTPRAVDFALEADVTLPVVERELTMHQPLQARPLRPLPATQVRLPPVEVAVPEHSIALRQAAPTMRPARSREPSMPVSESAPLTVREREIAMRQAAPALMGVRASASGIAASTADVAVVEREISTPEHAPVLSGLRPATIPATSPGSGALPAVREHEIASRAPAPQITGLRPGSVAVPASASASAPGAAVAAPSVIERSVAVQGAGTGQATNAAAATPQAAGAALSAASTPSTPAAGSGQDWSRGNAGADDWSRAGQPGGRNDGLAGHGTPAGLRAADLAAYSNERGAPGGDNDQWTRQRLEAGGTWLQRPPPGHAPGRFDRYWVPNESLLAEWVRKGVRNVEIPLPGGSGSISCVISLLQLGGGCGVRDPNMQEQPAQARSAPEVPFKPALHNESGSP